MAQTGSSSTTRSCQPCSRGWSHPPTSAPALPAIVLRQAGRPAEPAAVAIAVAVRRAVPVPVPVLALVLVPAIAAKGPIAARLAVAVAAWSRVCPSCQGRRPVIHRRVSPDPLLPSSLSRVCCMGCPSFVSGLPSVGTLESRQLDSLLIKASIHLQIWIAPDRTEGERQPPISPLTVSSEHDAGFSALPSQNTCDPALETATDIGTTSQSRGRPSLQGLSGISS